MSSHHIVKEDQEPALLIIETIDSAIFNQLLEWSPQVIVLQDAVEQISLLGIKIDVVICERRYYDELKQVVAHQAPVKFITIEEPYLNLALEGMRFLAERGYPAVHLVGTVGRKLMDLLARVPAMDIVIWDQRHKWSCCRSGLFRKWVPQNHRFITYNIDHISIHADTDIESEKEDNLTKINVLKEGTVAFRSLGKVFWLGEKVN